MVIPILTKLLGALDYGVWTQLRVTVMMLVPFLTFGTGQAIVKFLAGESKKDRIREDLFSCLFAAAMASAVVACVCIIFSRTVSTWIFGSSQYYVLANALAVLLVFESVNLILLEYFKAFRYIKTYFKTVLVETLLEFGFIAYAVVKGYGILGAVVALLMVRILFVLIRSFQVSRVIGFSFPRFLDLRKYAAFGIPLVISSFLFFILNWSNRYLINYFLGLKEVGKYSVAYFLAYVVTLIATPIGYILFPTLSGCINRSELGEAAVYLRYSLKYFLVAGIPLVFGISFLSKELLTLFSTPEFLVTRAYLPILLFGIFIFQIGVIGEYVNMIFNKNVLIMRVYLVLAIVNTILNILLIPSMGAMGAAVALLLSFVGYSVFNLIYCQRFVRFSVEVSTVSKILLAAFIMILGLYLFKGTFQNVNALFFVPVGAVLYIISLYLTGCFTDKEIVLFGSMLTRRAAIDEKI
jgi:O-antigen/teichoic acid export membrane protein